MIQSSSKHRWGFLMSKENEAADEGLLEIDLSTDDAQILIAVYVCDNLTKESATIFNECMKNDMGIEKSIYHAILNETIIHALQDKISRKMITASKEICNDMEL